MKTKRHYKKMDNIFNGYAGITSDKRLYNPPSGVKTFKAVGEI